MNLNLYDLSKIRSKITNKYKSFTLENLISKIQSLNNDIENYTFVIKYNIKEKNKLIEWKQKIIIFVLVDNLNLLTKEETTEFFNHINFLIYILILFLNKFYIVFNFY